MNIFTASFLGHGKFGNVFETEKMLEEHILLKFLLQFSL